MLAPKYRPPRNLVLVMALVTQFLNLNKSPSELPSTPAVQVVQ
jgi:hypothetical protein